MFFQFQRAKCDIQSLVLLFAVFSSKISFRVYTHSLPNNYPPAASFTLLLVVMITGVCFARIFIINWISKVSVQSCISVNKTSRIKNILCKTIWTTNGTYFQFSFVAILYFVSKNWKLKFDKYTKFWQLLIFIEIRTDDS